MNYSGNSSLSSDVKQRILTTFEQTLELARDGNRQEALLGCDFVLRMDPQFEPAHVLQERLRSSSGPVQVQDLQPASASAEAAAAVADDPFADLEQARGASPVAQWTASGPATPVVPPTPTVVLPPPLQTSAMPTSLASGGGDSESDRRIRELLDEGQAAFDAGDPQGAIDAWSRIFLIDIDHQETSRRIEAARKLKAESERQVEEIFHDGLARQEAGDAAAARRAFQRVLEIQPTYFA